MEQLWAKVVGVQDKNWVLMPLDEAPDLMACVAGHYVVKFSDEDWTSARSIEVKKYQIPEYRMAQTQ